MRRLLWIGDAVCDSGFSRATHHTLETLRKDWDITVIGLNYRGDPHPYPYPIYPAYQPGGDLFGVSRVIPVCAKVQPDLVVIQNDPWNMGKYLEKFEALREGANINPVLTAVVAIDGKNAQTEVLNGFDHCIFWTDFAKDEAERGGYAGPSSVVPLGVDLNVYKAGDRTEARKRFGWPDAIPMDAFVVLNVNRNQPRKRMDLAMEYFAEFYNRGAKNAYMYFHVAPTGDFGYDLAQLTKYYGLRGRVMLADPGAFKGYTEEQLVDTYQSCNVYASTTVGEGWGLPALEAMACGIPCVLPDWAAYGDWAKGASILVPCNRTQASLNKVNVIGGIADKEAFVSALETLYNVPQVAASVSDQGLRRAHLPKYRWEHIGQSFADAVMRAYDAKILGV